jgi:hypothetical protein
MQSGEKLQLGGDVLLQRIFSAQNENHLLNAFVQRSNSSENHVLLLHAIPKSVLLNLGRKKIAALSCEHNFYVIFCKKYCFL